MKIMSFTSEDDTTHPSSCWVVTGISYSPKEKAAIIEIQGYRTKAAYIARKRQIVGGQKSYNCPKELYDQYFATSLIRGAGKSVTIQAYKFAEEQPDEKGVLFFAGATDDNADL